jgi:hypothetical protein
MKPAHPRFDLSDPDTRVTVVMRDGSDYTGARPYSPTVSDGVVTFWYENELRLIPLDLVRGVIFYSVKP